MVEGLHVPDMLLVDVVGNIPGDAPVQYGPNCEKVGVGPGFTVTATVALAVQFPAKEIVTVYVPVAAGVADAMVGF
jgi:hypothetical protein